MRRERPPELLRDILDFIDEIASWAPAAGEAIDEKTLYAVLHALQYIGEVVSRLPPEVMSLAPNVPWRNIRAMRNLIAHDYAGIDTPLSGRPSANDCQSSGQPLSRCWLSSPASDGSPLT